LKIFCSELFSIPLPEHDSFPMPKYRLLRERDQMVFSRCLDANLPIAVTMADGYAPNIDDVVDIHLQTVKAAGLHAVAYKSRIGSQPTSCGAQDESEALLPPGR
jgi:hypothetical protein